MTKVFIGGSRAVSRLSEPVFARLDRIIAKGLPVVIGDANGADKAVQLYLKGKNYPNVEVFCSGRVCRNNVGNWKQRKITSNSRARTFEFYSTKDRAMAEEASIGFMLWDGKSKGTLLNVFRLLRQQKKAVIYNAAEQRFYELKEPAHWETFIERCSDELRQKIKQQISIEEMEQMPLLPRTETRRRSSDVSLDIPAS